MVLFVRQGVSSREMIWSRFLLNKGGGNIKYLFQTVCYIIKEYTCHIKISERSLFICVMALD
jgi:hypothetical protein